MRVLVACEFSGVVRDAFLERGHDAVSCDLLPTESPGPHIQGDALWAMRSGRWDMLIAFPPCTYLSVVGNRHAKQPGRAEKRADALAFFMQFVESTIPKKCIENPVGHANTAYRKPDQIVHPYYFGERTLKRTCFWLFGLRPLIWQKNDDFFNQATATEYPEPVYFLATTGNAIHATEAMRGIPSKQRGHARSKFWHGIATAMADQWGGIARVRAA